MERRELAQRLLRIAREIAAEDPDAESTDEAPEFDAVAYFESKLTTHKKGNKRAWWDPPHNMLINETLMGTLNLWDFTILPFHASKTAYRPASTRFPEGIVIDPNWSSVTGDSYPETPRVCELMVEKVKAAESIDQSVKDELASIESHFKITIPDAIKTKLVAESVKTADRRWGVDRLRRRKILIPFDGSKPIQLGSWD